MSTRFEAYGDRVHQVLGSWIPHGRPVALLDFPNYGNVGDSAIWLGQLSYLQTYRKDCQVIWVSDAGLRHWPALPEFPAGTVILLSGGGNLGDVWPVHQVHRERVIRHYVNHRIIQLPQSIHFQSAANQRRCEDVFTAHPDLILLARDLESLGLASRLNRGRAHLCPDMALALGRLNRSDTPRHACVALLRKDKESVLVAEDTDVSEAGFDLRVTDWCTEPVTLAQRLERLLSRYPQRGRRLRPPLYRLLARERVRRGCRLLQSGRCVITDRLHAHLLCTLLEIPHVVLDNSYRKIGRFREVWDTGAGLCLVAGSVEEAVELAVGGTMERLREEAAYR